MVACARCALRIGCQPPRYVLQIGQALGVWSNTYPCIAVAARCRFTGANLFDVT